MPAFTESALGATGIAIQLPIDSLAVGSIKIITFKTTPRLNLFHRKTTGDALISAILSKTQFSSSFFGLNTNVAQKDSGYFQEHELN